MRAEARWGRGCWNKGASGQKHVDAGAHLDRNTLDHRCIGAELRLGRSRFKGCVGAGYHIVAGCCWGRITFDNKG